VRQRGCSLLKRRWACGFSIVAAADALLNRILVLRKMAGNPRKPTNVWAQVGYYTSMGFILPAGAVVGSVGGWLLDARLHTSPWLTVILGFLGAAGGLIEVLRMLKRAEKDGGGDN
jgi:F0F1-type ATP synthase assembly protein I